MTVTLVCAVKPLPQSSVNSVGCPMGPTTTPEDAGEARPGEPESIGVLVSAHFAGKSLPDQESVVFDPTCTLDGSAVKLKIAGVGVVTTIVSLLIPPKQVEPLAVTPV